MQWFKYMESCWAKELVEQGKLRISSLDYYKKIELHGNAVGDADENIRHAVSQSNKPKTNLELNEFEKKIFHSDVIDTKEVATFVGTKFTRPVAGRPTYGFCLSDRLSFGIANRMNQENRLAGIPEYDACVRFENHLQLVEVLSCHASKSNLQYYGHGHCFYKSRDFPWDQWDKFHQQCPAFIKEPPYSWQKEVRIIFDSSFAETDEYLPLEIPELTGICELVEIPGFKTGDI